jgi:CheY-like chemotaxis protein
MSDDDEFLFDDDDDSSGGSDAFEDALAIENKPWRLLIVDDEEEVHAVTKLVLSNYEFAGRKLEFVNAFTARQAIQILDEDQDFAVAIIDCVMETDHAGLDLIQYIRDTLQNKIMRLVLRTGQPGQAPEDSVISRFDINDYKDKTELTAIKLKTLMYAVLRSYRDISALDINRKGLELIIETTAKLYESRNLNQFASAILLQLTAILGLGKDAAYVKVVKGFAATEDHGDYLLLAGTGEYESLINQDIRGQIPVDICHDLDEACSVKHNLYFKDHLIAYFRTPQGSEHLLFIYNYSKLSELDKNLVQVFCSNVSIAFETLSFEGEKE